MTISNENFTFLCNLLRTRSGISLSEGKAYLLDSRLLPLVRKLGLKDISELVSKVRMLKDEKVISEIIEAMTTNETSFFRDIKPFDCFREKVIPHFISKNIKRIRIWSGACSTGQEVYSLVMTILENKAKFGDCSFEIVATDIDKTIIKRAEDAIYSQFEVQRGLPITLLMKYFRQEKHYGDKWLFSDEAKSMVTFKYLNLLDSYANLGKFDVIFCRNVLIYFDQDLKTKILNKLCESLTPNGILFLGSADSIMDVADKLKPFGEQSGVFSKK